MITRADLDELERDAGEQRYVNWPQEKVLELIGRTRELMDEVDQHVAGADYSWPGEGAFSAAQLWGKLLTVRPEVRATLLLLLLPSSGVNSQPT